MFFSETLRGISLSDPASSGAIPAFVPDGGINALSGLRYPHVSSYIVGPASAAPPGDDRGHGAALCRAAAHVLLRAWGACDLPLIDPTCATETAGADGLKIAETFPEGRGSPHGCGLRAVFCRDAASARPEACRDKSKVPRSGDFAGRSPGVQGRRRLAAPVRSLRHE